MAKDQALYEFGKSAKELANLLESDSPIDETEQLLLENHLYLLGMAYAGWKLRNSPTMKAEMPTNDE